ncbi:hypothetical protein LEMLEM_LOCUS21324 [Lemmus lemmus]
MLLNQALMFIFSFLKAEGAGGEWRGCETIFIPRVGDLALGRSAAMMGSHDEAWGGHIVRHGGPPGTTYRGLEVALPSAMGAM